MRLIPDDWWQFVFLNKSHVCATALLPQENQTIPAVFPQQPKIPFPRYSRYPNYRAAVYVVRIFSLIR